MLCIICFVIIQYIIAAQHILSLVGSSLSRYMLVAKTLVPLPHYVVGLVKSKILHTEYLDMDCFHQTIFSTIPVFCAPPLRDLLTNLHKLFRRRHFQQEAAAEDESY